MRIKLISADASHHYSFLILFLYLFCSLFVSSLQNALFSFLVHFPHLHYELCVCYLDSHKCMFSLKIWGKYSFKKPISFKILTKSLWCSVGSDSIALSLLGREEKGIQKRKGRKRKAEKRKEKKKEGRMKASKQEGRKKEKATLHHLELLSRLLLMCVRSNSGRNHKTAAIPYFEMSIKKPWYNL